MKQLSLEEIQSAEIKILEQFDKICGENGFEYMLYFGSLLGAVRHKGMIPWDDDIDVIMPRDSYDKFISYCIANQKEILPFRLYNYQIQNNLCFSISRFSDDSYIIDEHALKVTGMGLFIDIYPFDECGNSISDIKKIIKKLEIIRGMCVQGARTEFIPHYDSAFKKTLQRISYAVAQITGPKIYAVILNNMAKARNGRGYCIMGCSVWQKDYQSYAEKELLVPVKTEFEGKLYPVPCGYHQILTSIYGDYMQLPPVEQRNTSRHEYNAFKRNED